MPRRSRRLRERHQREQVTQSEQEIDAMETERDPMQTERDLIQTERDPMQTEEDALPTLIDTYPPSYEVSEAKQRPVSEWTHDPSVEATFRSWVPPQKHKRHYEIQTSIQRQLEDPRLERIRYRDQPGAVPELVHHYVTPEGDLEEYRDEEEDDDWMVEYKKWVRSAHPDEQEDFKDFIQDSLESMDPQKYHTAKSKAVQKAIKDHFQRGTIKKQIIYGLRQLKHLSRENQFKLRQIWENSKDYCFENRGKMILLAQILGWSTFNYCSIMGGKRFKKNIRRKISKKSNKKGGRRNKSKRNKNRSNKKNNRCNKSKRRNKKGGRRNKSKRRCRK
tara:strand:- start:4746 stop:5744 length:999 start_codon:yes stop_codon:yes gene_type:complete